MGICYFFLCVWGMPPLSPLSSLDLYTCMSFLKGHSQLMHMRIRYHFFADLHITNWHETESKKRTRNNSKQTLN